MTNEILIIARSAPYGSSLAREGIDYILTSAAYDQDISILFLGDGVFQILKHQNPSDIKLKSHLAALEILPLYDIEKLYAVKEDLLERGLDIGQLGVKVSVIERSQVNSLIDSQNKVLSF
jgi:tRNA 2-thiouridine synthesizing protein C